MNNDYSTSDDAVAVIYVRKIDVKTVKNALEEGGWIHKNYRISKAQEDSFQSNLEDASFRDCMAIPILPSFLPEQQEGFSGRSFIVGTGKQPCPFSSSVLGNRQKRQILQQSSSTENINNNWSPLKDALLRAVLSFFQLNSGKKCKEHIANLSTSICPAKLEKLGDDKNLVLPPTAMTSSDLEEFLHDKLQLKCCDMDLFMKNLWNRVAVTYLCPRVLRKGVVDPNSRIRQTGYRLLWPSPSSLDDDNLHWITVTEQGIRQSFDVTQVMFSRGNISEKIRFGTQLVQKGDVVLDLYAGIGYYTLPALLQGNASHVYACEWNPRALQALERNVRDNQVQDRVSIVAGDCRNLILPFVETAPINRVSLGLLPSSEGGWKTAIQALLGTLSRREEATDNVSLERRPVQKNKGGWLHVHGNVPAKERDSWAQWMVRKLYRLLLEETSSNELLVGWIMACLHVEKVKSFAPTVNHYVADVFVGPRSELGAHPQHPDAMLGAASKEEACLFYDSAKQRFEGCPDTISPPSCALSADGVLHQEWMRESAHVEN